MKFENFDWNISKWIVTGDQFKVTTQQNDTTVHYPSTQFQQNFNAEKINVWFLFFIQKWNSFNPIRYVITPTSCRFESILKKKSLCNDKSGNINYKKLWFEITFYLLLLSLQFILLDSGVWILIVTDNLVSIQRK